MATHRDLRQAGSVIRYDPAVMEPFEPRLFDTTWLRREGYHRGTAAGRGQAQFLHFADRDLVLRPYLRGGMVQKISRDLFLRTGLEQTRSLREFALMQWMGAQALPVPRAVAAQVVSVGLFYRAAIITERIPEAQPLEDLLRQGALHASLWGRIGQVVRHMHDLGVYHSDLNRRNILIDPKESVWLIDFDKCDRRTPGAWAQDNLSRLHRSLVKEDASGQTLHWTEADWSALLAGYGVPPT